MDKLNDMNASWLESFSQVDLSQLPTIDGGFGGGFPTWGSSGGKYDGTSWEISSDGMCYTDGRYY
jgi:hypothetical protein